MIVFDEKKHSNVICVEVIVVLRAAKGKVLAKRSVESDKHVTRHSKDRNRIGTENREDKSMLERAKDTGTGNRTRDLTRTLMYSVRNCEAFVITN